MHELNQIITEMKCVQNKVRASVDNHISKLIGDLLEDLEEWGLPYEEGLDIAIEYVLFQKVSYQGREEAKQQIENTIRELMLNDDLPS